MKKTLIIVLIIVCTLLLSCVVLAGCKETPTNENPSQSNPDANVEPINDEPAEEKAPNVDEYPYKDEREIDPDYDPIATWHPYPPYTVVDATPSTGPWYVLSAQPEGMYGTKMFYCVTPDDKYYIWTGDPRLDQVEIIDNMVWVELKRDISLETLWDTSSPYNDPASIDWGIEFESVEGDYRDYLREQLAKEGQRAKQFAAFHRRITFYLPQHDRQAVLDAIEILQERDDVFRAMFYTTDSFGRFDSESYSYLTEQWGLTDINISDLWSTLNISTEDIVKVGVVDSGIDGTHSAFSGRIDTAISHSFIDNSPLSDTYGHGTAVAGVLGANTAYEVPIYGVYPRINFVSYKVSNTDSVSLQNCANAIQSAKNDGIRIINFSISFGNATTDAPDNWAESEYADLYTAIRDFDGIVICAAGNSGVNIDGKKVAPAGFNLPNMIVIGARDNEDNARYYTSNYGEYTVDVFAPGENILTTYPVALTPSGYYPYASYSGTSFATPFVTGVAAILLSKYPSMTIPALKYAIISNEYNSNGTYDCYTHNTLNAGLVSGTLPTNGSHSCVWRTDQLTHCCRFCKIDLGYHDGNFSITSSGHVGTCTECGLSLNYSHIYTYEAASSQHTGTCLVCGYICSEEHNLVLYNSNSSSHIYYCSVCQVVLQGLHSFVYMSNGSATHSQVCSTCGYVQSTSNHNYGTSYSHTLTSHRQTCTVCGYNKDTPAGYTYSQYNDYYHKAHCSVCGDYDEQLHVWEQVSLIAYRCTKCNKLVVGGPIVHDSIEIPEGSRGEYEGVPFLYEGHWYVYYKDTLYALIEQNDEKE